MGKRRRARKRAKRWARWEGDCDQLGIPEDVRERLRKIEDPDKPGRVDWYAGRPA